VTGDSGALARTVRGGRGWELGTLSWGCGFRHSFDIWISTLRPDDWMRSHGRNTDEREEGISVEGRKQDGQLACGEQAAQRRCGGLIRAVGTALCQPRVETTRGTSKAQPWVDVGQYPEAPTGRP